MGRFPPLLWLILIGMLLLPTPAGRVLLDLAGGLFLALLALPVLLGGAGWIGWKILQSRIRTCEACGTSTMSSEDRCAVCGSPLPKNQKGGTSAQAFDDSLPASDVTIDIKAEDVDP